MGGNLRSASAQSPYCPSSPAIQIASGVAGLPAELAGLEHLAALTWSDAEAGCLAQRTFDRLHDRFLQNKYDPPSFALKLGHKDMRLATELGRELGVPMRLANMAFAEMTEALNPLPGTEAHILRQPHHPRTLLVIVLR